MTIEDEKSERLAEFSRLLDAWGGDPSRWPDNVRMRIAGLATAEAEPRRLLLEARSLGRTLDSARDAPAPTTAQARHALVDRIVAAAEAIPGLASATPAPSADVVELRPRPSRVVAPASSRWHTAGLVAASLLAGIYIGGTVNLMPMIQELAEAVGLPSTDHALGEDLGEEETP